MQIAELPEPHKTRHAVFAALILGFLFGSVVAPSLLSWGGPPPPTAIRVSLIPSIPTPPPPPPPPPPPEPEVKEEKPEPKPDAAAEAQRQAEIVRAQEEKRQEEERRQREEEKKKQEEEKRKQDEEKKKREEEKKRKEEEEKRRQEEEQARLKAEAAAAEAAQQAALEKRLSRVAASIAADIANRIKNHLITPDSVPNDGDIVVVVYVRLNADGSISGFPEILESSGFPEYDDAALRAVLKSAPLPMPREAFIREDQAIMQQFLEHRLYVRPQ